MKKHFLKVALGLMGLMGTLVIGVVNAQEINKDIKLEATSTAANQTLKINKYFANAYTVDWGDGSPVQDLTEDTVHTYSVVSGYTITLSLTGGDTRWKFTNIDYALVPISETTMSGIKIIYMPSLVDGFGNNASAPGNNFFRSFNREGAIESLPEGSFDTSNITTAGNYFFMNFNVKGKLTTLPGGSFRLSTGLTMASDFFFYSFNRSGYLISLPEGSFDISNIVRVGDNFFSTFNYGGALIGLPVGSFDTSNIVEVGDSFLSQFNFNGSLISLPGGSFKLATGLITVGDNFFTNFNRGGQLTALPDGSFNTNNIITVGDNFFASFNNKGKLTSLPGGSFDISNISGSVGDSFFENFNREGKLISLPEGSFDTSNITEVGNDFFYIFNYLGQLTSLPDGSFDISNISGSVGYKFFYGFNHSGQLVSLPEGSFRLSTGLTTAGYDFFRQFNAYGQIIHLPEGSFDTSNITTLGDTAFRYFNGYGAIEDLPEGSFDTSNITEVGTGFFSAFNYNGAITSIPDSLTLNSIGVSKSRGYQNAFNTFDYTINKKVSDLVNGITEPSSDMNTFSDNQPGRCGVHENWLVTTANACNIRYDANGGNGSVTGGYAANTTGVVAGSGITAPTRVGYVFSGWTNASGDIVENVSFPEMDGQTLYAKWRGKDIILQATSTAANQKIKINKYFANNYTINRGDGSSTTNASSTNTHTYSTAGTYTITLSLTGGADRWTFNTEYNANPLVPTNGTTMTGVKITSMPSLEEGFGINATAPGTRFFQNFNYNGAITSLPDGSFDTSKITTAGDGFFDCFNRAGKITSIPDGSFNISNITTVGTYFMASFNRFGEMTSLPTGSFILSSGLTVADEYFFSSFNWGGALTSLPEGSFDTSNITTAKIYFFPSFNREGALTSLPEGSFDTSNITSANSYFFEAFNRDGALTNLPDSFNISSKAYNKSNAYYNAFNSPNYEINKKVSDLVLGVTVPSSDQDTFSDNRSGRCGVHENWLVSTANACSITYDDGVGGTGEFKYTADTTGVVVGSGMLVPSREGYTFSGWINASGNKVDEIVFPDMDGETLYANWEANVYTITLDIDGTLTTITGSYGSPITPPANPTKNGYKFIGWEPEIPATMPAIDMTIKAKWEKNGSSGGGRGSSNKASDTQDSSDKVYTASSASEGHTYTQEFQEAYEFAKEKGITTMPTIQKADMDGKLTRIAMAKMLSQYAINVLGMAPDITQNNKFNDVTEKMDSDYDDGVTLAYQLGIMGQNMPNNKFRPNDEVTRGEFVTALSRMLYNTSDGEYRSTPKYYTHHMEKMVGEGIITNTDPNMKELRGYVMIMLMRSVK